MTAKVCKAETQQPPESPWQGGPPRENNGRRVTTAVDICDGVLYLASVELIGDSIAVVPGSLTQHLLPRFADAASLRDALDFILTQYMRRCDTAVVTVVPDEWRVDHPLGPDQAQWSRPYDTAIAALRAWMEYEDGVRRDEITTPSTGNQSGRAS